MGSRRLVGTVVRFDEAVGLGDIAAAVSTGAGDGGAAGRYPFHCTQIADGSRTVAVGARVSFGLLAGRAGRWEAADIRSAAE
jgi:cold shock CspA family protein